MFILITYWPVFRCNSDLNFSLLAVVISNGIAYGLHRIKCVLLSGKSPQDYTNHTLVILFSIGQMGVGSLIHVTSHILANIGSTKLIIRYCHSLLYCELSR